MFSSFFWECDRPSIFKAEILTEDRKYICPVAKLPRPELAAALFLRSSVEAEEAGFNFDVRPRVLRVEIESLVACFHEFTVTNDLVTEKRVQGHLLYLVWAWAQPEPEEVASNYGRRMIMT
ncbi:4-hydroxy-3-methylbut-2-enyl diphosphatereductase [Striga asiatica]|uniref:4-hydroxy-3-methylbut-2-enyl diphosphatereductase n=1 Tax=Striga asiatica TaxID=4170 RepID=A0A5A7P0R3_STRAF|nr:4-hydroxy-3-methylbut-2-enyl diphosphatereductase [Striga asiatica]